ncbi:hypothetical protein C4B68_14805 [Streptomyces dengpaensis]|uniref:LPXTG cell wall anchor domain-containing protein n=1 Tax=Streptomyces dengpaensis TaxID=2049881 RepID=A0ABM6SRA7_9ACTN|nr:hypothetical protein C4B68_14805 [Streptomyces dengpaensis]
MLTATAAGSLLGALWFVPSANATQDEPIPSVSASTTASTVTTTAVRESTEATAESGEAQDHTQLADTGSVDTTPYVFGGTLFLGLGAGFIFYSVRRERTMAY